MKNTLEKYEYCKTITKDCLDRAEITDLKARELLKWAKDYYTDAEYYFKKGDINTALEAVAYAHGFIDSAVLLGLIKIKDYHLKGL